VQSDWEEMTKVIVNLAYAQAKRPSHSGYSAKKSSLLPDRTLPVCLINQEGRTRSTALCTSDEKSSLKSAHKEFPRVLV